MVDGILLSKCGMVTMKNENLSLLSKSLQRNIPSPILMLRPKNVACSTTSSFSSNSPGYIYLKDFARRSSMNRLVTWYLLFDFLKIRF